MPSVDDALVDLKLFDMTGQLVHNVGSKLLQAETNTTIKLEVGYLASGTYVLRMSNGRFSESKVVSIVGDQV